MRLNQLMVTGVSGQNQSAAGHVQTWSTILLAPVPSQSLDLGERLAKGMNSGLNRAQLAQKIQSEIQVLFASN